MKTMLILVAALLLNPFSAVADDLVPKTKVFKFFDKLIRDDTRDAFADLLEKSPMQKRGKETEQLLKQMEAALTAYGKATGFEVFLEEPFGASILRITAVLKLKEQPLIWEFYFYKPEGEWLVAHVHFTDRLDVFRSQWFIPPVEKK